MAKPSVKTAARRRSVSIARTREHIGKALRTEHDVDHVRIVGLVDRDEAVRQHPARIGEPAHQPQPAHGLASPRLLNAVELDASAGQSHIHGDEPAACIDQLRLQLVDAPSILGDPLREDLRLVADPSERAPFRIEPRVQIERRAFRRAR
jgi:hypothetical protein